MNRLDSQKTDFLKFYQKIFSNDELLEILSASKRCLRLQTSYEQDPQLLKSLSGKNFSWCQTAYSLSSDEMKNYSSESPAYYLMDPASLIPVLLLAPQPGEKIVDLCAAPGGKTLFILDLVKQQCELWAADISDSRLYRMKKNLKRMQVDIDKIQFHCGSPRTLPKKEYFDKVLLDVPCSSEAHVWQAPQELKKWSPTRTTLLAKRQRKIFAQGLALARPGARLVYSTCSISPQENEENVAFFLKKWAGKIETEEINIPDLKFEKKKYGAAVYPTRHGMGPMYFCMFKKL